jgi:hypothetical protein
LQRICDAVKVSHALKSWSLAILAITFFPPTGKGSASPLKNIMDNNFANRMQCLLNNYPEGVL